MTQPTPEPEEGLTRAEAAEQTRMTILEAATLLFGRFGYKKVSIAQIAEDAGVARGTIYVHHDSKRALFRAVCEHTIAVFLSRVDAALGREDLGALERAQEAILAKMLYFHELVFQSPHVDDLVATNAELGQDLFERADAVFLERITGALDEATEAGALDAPAHGATTAQLASLLIAAARGVETELARGPYEARVRAILGAMLRGFAPPSG